MPRELDIIIFGATGFTGKYAIPLVYKLSKTKTRQLTWGVAGRSEQKLKNLLVECEQEMGTSLKHIPVIIADVQDEKSLKEMARKARVIINCCGPFGLFGEPVVKACVEEGTHHVDVTAELLFMESMQLKYHNLAQEKGAYVVSACGFDCIPTDLGVVFLQQKFKGTLNSAVTYLEGWEEGEPIPGPYFNNATWKSVVNELAHGKKGLEVIRSQLFPNPLPSFRPELKLKVPIHKSDLVGGWAAPLPSADRDVVIRSQRNFYEKDSKRPIQIQTYVAFKSFWHVLNLLIFGFIILLLVQFQWGRNLLLKYPEMFSNGLIGGEEQPNKEKIEKTHFSVTLYGEGWKEKLSDPNDEYSTPPDRAIGAKVRGKNPGYGSACVCLVLAAITIITETDKMPSRGGVYPPGYAFARTSLIEQINENGVTFDVLFEKNLSSSK